MSKIFLTVQVLESCTYRHTHGSFPGGLYTYKYDKISRYASTPISSFWKNKSRLMRSPCCPYVCRCIPPLTFEWLNQFLWNLECISRHWAHLNGTLHTSLPSVIPTSQPFELLTQCHMRSHLNSVHHKYLSSEIPTLQPLKFLIHNYSL
jgi:hypothetical protein